MDTFSIFEQKLKYNQQPLQSVETDWDQKADTFYQNQVKGSTYYNDAVPQLLEEKGLLKPTSTVLDICSGSGRYAIPFAKRCKSVHALDLSSQMLGFLQTEMDKNNLKNIHTVKSSWPTTENIGDFDIAFAAMCPATRSVEALQAMSEIAEKYGVVCQFTASTDSAIEALKSHGIFDEDIKGPHNNRDILQAYFNILWELGYQPEISYLHDTFEVKTTLEEAVATYKKRYDHLEPQEIRSALSKIQENNVIRNMKYTTLAVISWKTGMAYNDRDN